jgi:hypothetical protein
VSEALGADVLQYLTPRPAGQSVRSEVSVFHGLISVKCLGRYAVGFPEYAFAQVLERVCAGDLFSHHVAVVERSAGEVADGVFASFGATGDSDDQIEFILSQERPLPVVGMITPILVCWIR